jgi:hypothetical protein
MATARQVVLGSIQSTSDLVSNPAGDALSGRCRSSCFVIAAVAAMSGCDFMSRDSPGVSKPLGYGTISVALPGCATPLPPVREAAECGALEIGKRIDPVDVCDLLESLKKWVAAGPSSGKLTVRSDDWAQVRAVCVTRFDGRVRSMSQQPPVPPPAPGVFPRDEKRAAAARSDLRLEADLPNRSLRIGVQTSEHGRLEYYVTAR